jgi:sugar fermentation stimulation protein A
MTHPAGDALDFETSTHVSLGGPLVEGRFVDRPNRFLVRVRVPGEPEPLEAHLPDPGRLRELLIPDSRLWIRPAKTGPRRTAWTAVLVQASDEGDLVSLDTGLPNRLIRQAIDGGALTELAGWSLLRSEFALGRSRIDFLLVGRSGDRLALEVKSVTLVEDRVGLFPDAVTARGARHVEELTRVVQKPGWHAAILFVLQRQGADRVLAARSIDPTFADALAQARATGVRVLGRRCTVTLDRVFLGQAIPAG